MSKLTTILKVTFLLFTLTGSLQAQENLRIRGKVVDAATGKIIPFVTVQIKGVPLGSITEEDGKFAVKIPLEYARDTLIFSSVGYEKLEYAIADLKEEVENLISLTEAVMELEEVTVTRGKKKKPLKLLKEAIDKIPQNFQTETHTFDAYYRERIIENGATIKFADAATTFQQNGYTGEVSKRGGRKVWRNYYSSTRTGIRLGGSQGMFNYVPAGSRLHDHFSVNWKTDRVKIHDARASLNLTREKMQANIEGGPLSTLGKDLARNLDLFMHKKKHKKYVYELFETPDEQGTWYYVVKFKPKKAPATLLWIRERRAKDKLISRLNILSGEVWIEQDNMAISKMRYSVQNNYRRHICNLQENEIKHYGYEVETNYQQIDGKWQLKDILRKDEFIFKDTITDKTTPYATITELTVTNPKSDLKEVPARENFLNVTENSLYEYPLEYNPDFWEAYEAKVPMARLDEALRTEMQTVNTLEEQFAMKHMRDTTLLPPVAKTIEASNKYHGTRLPDEYAWMKEPKNPRANKDLMTYLEKENEYTDNYFIPLRRTERDLIDRFYRQIDREAKTDSVKSYGYWYWSKYAGDDDYRTIYRREDQPGAKAEVLWDLDSLAQDKNYFSLSFYSISPDNQYMAYAIDTVGDQRPITRIKEMATGKILPDSISNMGGFVWTEDSQGFFYSTVDTKSLMTKDIKYHTLGTPASTDSLYFDEPSQAVGLSISKTRSKKYLYAYRYLTNSNELYIARNQAPYVFKKVQDAREDVSYSFQHIKDQFYISTNEGAPNGKLMKTDTANFTPDYWTTVVAHEDSVMLLDYAVFENYLVTLKTEKLKDRIEVTNLKTNKTKVLPIKGPGEVYSLSLGNNTKIEADTLRYFVSAPDYKTRKVAYHLASGKSKRKLASKVPEDIFTYVNKFTRTKLLWVPVRDGTKVPVSLVYLGRKEKYLYNDALYVTGYGAYGIGGGLGYSEGIKTLLRKGFVFANVHVRGGGELGKYWHDQGRMENKMNTFTDFIDAVEYLTSNGYGSKDKVFAQGGSAGGLLMGGVVNMRPDLFKGVFLDVPFVDVINTMMDENLPLTTGEFKEWGNPKKKDEFKNMLEYSPYDNVKAQAYPRMAFTTGLNDKNVGYWEAAKMVARLRAMKTDDNILLLRTNMYGGHSGNTGRFAGLAELANQYSILFAWLDEVNEELRKERALKLQNK